MKILGKEIKPGDSKVIEVEVAKLHTRDNLHIPIIIERAKKNGPTLLLIGGIHGDEVNGVAIIREIIKTGSNKPTRGTVICIPVFNIFGYLHQTREFPDGRDLNRVFPGSSKGSLASQFAHQFVTEIAPLVDYVVDFHSGSVDRDNIPHVRCVISEEKSFEFAKAFGAPFIVHSKYIGKSIRETLFKMGKTTLLFEGGKSKSIDNVVLQSGVQGAKNIMAHLGMNESAYRMESNTIVVKKSSWLRAKHSGMLHLKINNGAFVKEKEVLGYIIDPYGDFEKKIKAPHSGYIICTNRTAIVNRGDALFHISIEDYILENPLWPA